MFKESQAASFLALDHGAVDLQTQRAAELRFLMDPPWGVGVQARRRDLRGRAGGGTWERVVIHQVSTFIKDHGRKKKTTGARFLTVGKRRYKYIEKT